MRRSPLVTFLLRWAINALGIVVAASIGIGISYGDDFGTLAIVVVVLGLFNAFLKPVLVLFALPFVVATLGVGILVINALLLELADYLIGPFEVKSFFSAFLAALVIALLNLLLGGAVGEAGLPVRGRRSRGTPPPEGKRDDVIDI